MNATTIKHLIASGESQQVEFKQSASSAKDLAREVVAFANTSGGVLILGIDDTAAREDLGFRVTISWVVGARRTVKWLEENGQLQKSEDFRYYDRMIEMWQQAVGKVTVRP